VHPVTGLITFMDAIEKEKDEWKNKDPKIVTS